jgi:hypothetical protein
VESKRVAIDILTEAGRQVGGGKDIHGSVSGSYGMIAEMWTVYLRHSNLQRHRQGDIPLTIDAQDVLEMMSILKKCRGVYSPEMNRENYIDDVGYVALAGMVAQAEETPHNE